MVTDLAAIAAEFGDDPGAPLPTAAITHEGPIWRWTSPNPDTVAAWFFVTLAGPTADAIRAAAQGRTGGFGSIKVEAVIGAARWKTSLFPSKELGGYLLPVKAEVRRKAGADEGDMVSVSVTVLATPARKAR